MLSLTALLEFNCRWPSIVSGEVLALTVLMAFAILATLEFHTPREKLPKKHLRQSYKTNISLFIVNSIVMSLVSASSLLYWPNVIPTKDCLTHYPAPHGKQSCRFSCSIC